MKILLRSHSSAFGEIFNFQDDESKGRIIALTSTLLSTVYNVFIGGIFYTGFLSMYGMSITDAGILGFVPYLCNLLGIFSPKLLSRFPKRKGILMSAKAVFYLIYVVLTTVMPQIVTDPDARLTWFIALSAVAHAFYALFSNGITNWMYTFYPKNNDLRLRYLTLTQIFSSVLSSVILLSSGYLTDALSNSPYQDSLILIFRYFAFVLVLVDVFITCKAKEFPYEESAQVKLKDVITLPFRHKKFMFCVGLMFAWNFGSALSGLWTYHLLNHLDYSYTLINITSVSYTVLLIFLSPLWNRVLRRVSWVRCVGISFLGTSVVNFALFFMTKETDSLFLILSIYSNAAAIGANIAYANLQYMNMPKENSTVFITFYTIGANLFAFFGMLTGTWISSITGDNPIHLLGIDVYSVQFDVVLVGGFQLVLGLIMLLKWKTFTSDAEISRINLMYGGKRRKY